MSALWRCGVCETVNDGGRSCAACGADMTRRSAAVTAVRTRVAPPSRPLPPPTPVVEPVRRAVSREPVPEEEWAEYEEENHLKFVPLPGGCLMIGGRGSW